MYFKEKSDRNILRNTYTTATVLFIVSEVKFRYSVSVLFFILHYILKRYSILRRIKTSISNEEKLNSIDHLQEKKETK